MSQAGDHQHLCARVADGEPGGGGAQGHRGHCTGALGQGPGSGVGPGAEDTDLVIRRLGDTGGGQETRQH